MHELLFFTITALFFLGKVHVFVGQKFLRVVKCFQEIIDHH